MIKGKEYLSQGDAERAGTAHPGEEKAQQDLTHMYKYLTGECKEEKSDAHCQDNGHKSVQKMPFKHKELPYCDGGQHWHRFLRNIVEYPSLEIFNFQADVALSYPALADPA